MRVQKNKENIFFQLELKIPALVLCLFLMGQFLYYSMVFNILIVHSRSSQKTCPFTLFDTKESNVQWCFTLTLIFIDGHKARQ